jgi:cellulose synthase/poly-beta-1,6-N-acetylglucosamine synthase-like glycosyltransferase
VETDGEKWRLMSGYMDLTPCRFESKERFESCLEAVNSYDYPVYVSEGSASGKQQLSVRQIEVPNRSTPRDEINRSRAAPIVEEGSGLLESLLSSLHSFFQLQ